MENLVGIGIVIVIAGFVVYKIFWGKDEVSAPAPVKAPAPAPAPVDISISFVIS